MGSESGSFYPRSSRSDYVRSTTLQIVIQFFLSVNHSRFKVASFYTALLGITDPLLLKIFPVSATTRSAPMALFYSRHNLMKLKPYTGAHTYIMSLKSITDIFLKAFSLRNFLQCWGSGSGSAGSACFWAIRIRNHYRSGSRSFFLIKVLSGLK